MERKIESFGPKNLGQIFILPVIEFLGQNGSFFSHGAVSEKIESF